MPNGTARKFKSPILGDFNKNQSCFSNLKVNSSTSVLYLVFIYTYHFLNL